MIIVSCLKVVPDEQDIAVQGNGDLAFDRARLTISTYDLNAIEAGVQLAEANGGTLIALSVGSGNIDDSKIKKNVLSRGPGSLVMVADDSLKDMDANQTAQALKAAIDKIGSPDLVICGEGSADLYAQQVGAQLGQLMRVPIINCISKISVIEGKIVAERSLENETEILGIPCPSVISVTSDINLPRVAGMKEILAAGKKPGSVWKADDVGLTALAPTIEVIETKAPRKLERKQDIINGDSGEQIQDFIAKLREVLI